MAPPLAAWRAACVDNAASLTARRNAAPGRLALRLDALVVTLALMTIGSSGMYVVAVVLPAVQAEFGVARADASLPYTLLMIGFGLGGMLMGRLADRFGVMVPLLIGAAGLGGGFVARRHGRQPVDVRARARRAARAARQLGDLRAAGRRHLAVVRAPARHRGRDLRERQLPRRRDLAADRAALRRDGRLAPDLHRPRRVLRRSRCRCWRLLMRPRPPAAAAGARGAAARARARPPQRPFGLSLNQAQALLCVAGVACCVAMSMPQVHIVAYCGDLGYGAARGAEMLSLMLAFGIVSRLDLGRDLRPHRRPAHAAARLGAARHGAAAVPAVRRRSSRCT